MINRSSISRLLVENNRTSKPSNKKSELISKKYGSLTGNFFNDPALKALRAPKKDVEKGLPKKYKGDFNNKHEDGAEIYKRRQKHKRAERPFFDEPEELGPNARNKVLKNKYKHGGHIDDDHFWIEKAIKKPGSLRRSLHVKKGHPIPESKLEKAEHSRNPTTRRRARLAETLKGFQH